MIKIGGGIFRSRNLNVPASLDVPTKSIVRLGIANALTMYCKDARVLDLFAGSGAVGIELLSRGAKSCTFADISPDCVSVINSNLETLGLAKNDVYLGPSQSVLNLLISKKDTFDIVFLDPPYASQEAYDSIPNFLVESGLLSKRGILVIEYENPYAKPTFSFAKMKTYNYGRTKVDIYWRSL
jgi:16S rRNA (guanine966-N2)-methyltransferase